MKPLLRENEAVVQSEADFHDARIGRPHERRLNYAYDSVRDVYEFTDVQPSCRQGSVLEGGCFRGEVPLAMAGFAGRYVGIDISPAAVQHCKQLRLPASFEFRVDDGNSLSTIVDGSVDYAFGRGVLHHLDLAMFAPALKRVLSRGGHARFVEPAQGNVALRAFRRLTPRLRTPDEHPIDGEAIQTLEEQFEVRISHQALVRPFAPMLFLNSRTITGVSRWLDERLLRHRILQGQAWLLQIELRHRVS